MLNKILSQLVVKNVKTGLPSYNLTAFIMGAFIINAKMLVSGMDICGVKMTVITGVEYAAAMASLGGIYNLSKHLGNKEEKK